MATTPILSQREQIYDTQTHDYALYLDGDLVGFARTQDEGDTVLDEVEYARLRARPLTETEALAHVLHTLNPALSLTDALDIINQTLPRMPGYTTAYGQEIAAALAVQARRKAALALVSR